MSQPYPFDPASDPGPQLGALEQQGGGFLSAEAAGQLRHAMDRSILAERFARGILDALDAHLAVLDAQGGIVAVNKAWRVFAQENGLDEVRVGPGVNYFAVCDAAKGPGEEEARAAVAGLRSLLRGERQLFELEYPCHSPTQQRWFVLRASRFEHEGAAYLAVAHENITQPRQEERQSNRAKETAEATQRARDQFLAVLSHELRTPLTPVLLRIAMVLRESAISTEMREDLEMIRRNVELESRLIEDVLDITRIGRGKLKLALEAVDAHETLTAAAGIYQSEAQAKHLSLVLDLQARQRYVQADPARLQQVFWNVIGNAVKYTLPGGSITVRSTNTSGGDLRVEVIDTGIGIEPELMPRIFTAFEQGEQTLTRRFGGLGLGLSISKSLVEMLGGTLSAASGGKGQGTTFAVNLMTTPAAATAPATPPPQHPPHHLLRILLVEDNEDTLRVLSYQLRRLGYQVKTATTLHQALSIAAAEMFDLIIADIGLPDGTGWDLMRKLRTRQPLQGIALSGFTSDEDVQRSREAGFTQHLAKPVLPERLQAVIEQITPRAQ